MQAGNISVRPGKQDLFEKEIRYNWVSFTALDIRVSFFSFFFFSFFRLYTQRLSSSFHQDVTA